MDDRDRRNDQVSDMTERGGTWVPSCPEPLWVGWRLRVARCQCGAQFRTCACGDSNDHAHSARERYQEHWEDVHGPGALQ